MEWNQERDGRGVISYFMANGINNTFGIFSLSIFIRGCVVVENSHKSRLPCSLKKSSKDILTPSPV